MKTHAALALLTAFALIAPGCGNREKTPEVKVGVANPPPAAPCPCKRPHEPNTVSVIVELTTDETGKPVARTRNKTAYACEGDTVEWILWPSSPGELLNPNFLDGSPFEGLEEPAVSQKSEKPTRATKIAKSGKVKKNAPKKSYDYTIQLKVENVFYVVDPRIEVME